MSRSKKRKKHRLLRTADAGVAAVGQMSQSPEAARPGASFGAMLRHAREERGISHDDVARDTRIAKRYVIALDNESIGTLPGGPYNRAYVRAYAAYVGLDADCIVRDYDRTVQEHSQTSLSAAQPDQIAALRAVIQQKESQTSGRKISPATSKGLLIASSIAGVVLAAGVWVGARRLSDAAEVPHAQLSTAAIGVSDAIAKSGQRANTGPAKFSTLEKEIHAPAAAEAYVESEPRVAEPQQEPRQIGATPVPTVLKKSGEIAITEDLLPATSISVNDSGVGTDIVNRALVGRSETFAAGTRVVFWTLVNGGHRGDTVRHVWFHRGRSVATVRLPVASASWRTHSQRVLGPGTDGEWAVEAQDEHGRVLARHAFRSGT